MGTKYTIELSQAQIDWTLHWLSCYSCPIECKSGNCIYCRRNNNTIRAVRRGLRK